MDLALALTFALAAFVLFALGALFTFVSGSGLVVAGYFAGLVVGSVLAAWWRRRRPSAGEPPWSARARRGLSALCLVLAGGLAGTFASTAVAIRPPGQAELAGWFQAHRAELERMRVIVANDRIGPDGAELERLRRATGCQGAGRWPDGSVYFSYGSWGMANRGWRAAVVWSPKEPRPLLATVDGFPGTKVPGSDQVFARIDGSWYAWMVW